MRADFETISKSAYQQYNRTYATPLQAGFETPTAECVGHPLSWKNA